MNIVAISGNLAREPEVTAMRNSEYSVIRFSIANNDERRKSNTGEWESVVSFFDCEFWTKNPQHWIRQMHKGTPVIVEGNLKQERWEQDGQARYAVRIKVRNFPIIARGREEGGSAPPQQQADAGPEVFEDDDIPF